MDMKEEYEITTLGKNHFTLKLTDRNSGQITMFSATRVIIPPPLTFMQKYGSTLLMAGMIIFQVGDLDLIMTDRWLQRQWWVTLWTNKKLSNRCLDSLLPFMFVSYSFSRILLSNINEYTANCFMHIKPVCISTWQKEMSEKWLKLEIVNTFY